MSKPDVMMAVMKLSRSMRRGPMRPGGPHREPPLGGGKLLTTLRENANTTSRELAELLDIRPSSLTELLTRLEKEELITRTADENDKRVSRVALTEKGEKLESELSAAYNENIEKFAACFTDEEAAQFCEMCERLSAHLESLHEERCREMPEGFPGGCRDHGDFPPPPPHGCRGHHGHHGPHGCHRHGGFGEPFGDRPPFDGDGFRPDDEPDFDKE